MDINVFSGENVRTMRLKRGLTIEQLAGNSNVGFSYLSSLERGERKLSVMVLDKIARALGVETAVLLMDQERIADDTISGIRLDRRQKDFDKLTIHQRLRIMHRLEEDIDDQLKLFEAGLIEDTEETEE